MNRNELMTILPHRDSMLLLDEAEVRDGIAYAKKRIRAEEWFLDGHFPGYPVVPGVILCEILAQSTAVCLADTPNVGSCITLLTGLDKVKFKHQVRPGDLLETRCEITRAKEPFYFAKGEGYVEGKLCVKAEFSFMLAPRMEAEA